MKYSCTTMLVVIAALLSGCHSTEKKDIAKIAPPQKFTLKDEAAGKNLSEQYIAALVKAVQNKDFNIISPQLHTDMLTIRQKRSTFTKLCQRLEQNGKLISYSFVTVADQTLCRDYIWQLNFEKQTGSDKLPVLKTVLLYSVRIIVDKNKPEIIRTRLIQL